MSNGRTIRRRVNRSARGLKKYIKGSTGWRKRAGQVGRVDTHVHYDTRKAPVEAA
jgi:hypothetical protein